jgi:hypothetical protein
MRTVASFLIITYYYFPSKISAKDSRRMALIKLAPIRIWLCVSESTLW